MKNENSSIKEGDKIILLFMEGENKMRLGTLGVVEKIIQDPFEQDNKIVYVKWENGSSLSLMSKYDKWKKIVDSPINENAGKYFSKNKEIFDLFDHKFFRKYLKKIQESGIINIFGAGPLLYSGAEHIERYYGENPPNEDAYMDLLEMANTAKDKMIQGTMKSLERDGKEITLEAVQSRIGKYANKLLEFFMSFY